VKHITILYFHHRPFVVKTAEKGAEQYCNKLTKVQTY